MTAKTADTGEEKKTTTDPYFYAVGKRKTATAIIKIFPNGKGEALVNGRKLEDFFKTKKDVESFFAPFGVVELDPKKYNLEIKIVGGGVAAAAEACLHGISRALVLEDKNRHLALKKAGFLTRDGRAKERKKPGLKRARRSPQWSKR